MSFLKPVLASAALLALSISFASAQSAKASLMNAKGEAAGQAQFTQTPAGVLIRLTLNGLPGERAMHIHAVGKCEPPFTSAGGHFNPGNKKHGLHAADGHHAGDMPNIVVPASGSTTVEVLNAAVTLEKGKPNSLIREGGTSIVVHEGKDDYKSDPAGEAGGRAACGVIME
jgi:superoxide dismutase, Cu-Zn family